MELEIENIFLEIASFVSGPTKRLFIWVILVAAQIHGPQLAFGKEVGRLEIVWQSRGIGSTNATLYIVWAKFWKETLITQLLEHCIK